MATAEQKLWQAVVNQALVDAVARPSGDPAQRRRMEHDRDEARTWLLGNSADFFRVCDMAGYAPSYVRKGAIQLALRGWPADAIRKVRPLAEAA